MCKWGNNLTYKLPKNCFKSSSYHSGAYEYTVERMFNNENDISTYAGFQVDYPSNNDWFSIDLQSLCRPSKISLKANENLHLPKSLKITMSTNGENYDYIDTITNILNNDTKIHEYQFKEPEKKYRYLKIYFQNSINIRLCEIARMEIFEECTTKYLIKQNNIYYSLKSLFYKSEQFKDDLEKEQFYKENGLYDINELSSKKTSKLIDLKLIITKENYKTVIPIDFNQVTNTIEYICENNKKGIKYNTEEYQLLDLIKKELGCKFQICKWEDI